MNSNPIAWMIDTLDGKHLMLYGSNPPPVFDSEVNAIPLYTHPVKELHLSLQKSKQTGELLAVTYTDDEHRIVEVLWQRPPVKEQDESFDRTASHMAGEYVSYPVKEQDTDCQYCKQGCIRCDARKQLTDEEIGQLKGEWYRGDYASFYDLVRAILRKAQEK